MDKKNCKKKEPNKKLNTNENIAKDTNEFKRKKITYIVAIIICFIIPILSALFNQKSWFLSMYYFCLISSGLIVIEKNLRPIQLKNMKIIIVVSIALAPILLGIQNAQMQGEQFYQLDKDNKLSRGINNDVFKLGTEEVKSMGCAIPNSLHKDCNFNRAYFLYKGGGSKYAIEDMVKIRQANPEILDFPEYWHNLGYMYNQIDKKDESINALTQAINLNTPHEGVYCTLAKIYYEESNKRKALKILNRASNIIENDQKIIIYCKNMINQNMPISHKGFVAYWKARNK